MMIKRPASVVPARRVEVAGEANSDLITVALAGPAVKEEVGT